MTAAWSADHDHQNHLGRCLHQDAGAEMSCVPFNYVSNEERVLRNHREVVKQFLDSGQITFDPHIPPHDKDDRDYDHHLPFGEIVNGDAA